ncbi:Gfo/Idh/MocA family protein [candidate division KSB1 bacterium]
MKSEKKVVSRRKFMAESAGATAGLALAAGIGSPAILRGQNLNNTVGVGLIGIGIRGKNLLRSIGFPHPRWLERQAARRPNAPKPRKVEGVRINGVCEVYKSYLRYGIEASGGGAAGYDDYRRMLDDKDIDAVVIATPDHWHAAMAIDASSAGKAVYCEKCMTHNVDETLVMVDTIKRNRTVFQIGHQNRQSLTYRYAREKIIDTGMLGKINLVQTFTNRSDPNGAWIYPIPDDAGPKTVDWQKWLGKAPKRAYDNVRVFRWRCYWDYGTGLAGDLLTHEFDAVNMMLDLGIPDSAVATGGIYLWKENREVPDVFQVAFEYPERGLTVTYAATLGSSFRRGRTIMGMDATLDFSDGINVYPDRNSKTFQNHITETRRKFREMEKRTKSINEALEAVTSATERWTLDKGLMFTYSPEGQVVDATHLHFRNFIEAVRAGDPGLCLGDIETGYHEAIAAHMATASYKRGRQVHWDPERRRII